MPAQWWSIVNPYLVALWPAITDCGFLHRRQSVLVSFVRSFIGVARLLAVYVTCQCWGLGLAQCTTPLKLGLVLYIYRAQLSRWISLASCQWCGPLIWPLAPSICYPRRRLSPHPIRVWWHVTEEDKVGKVCYLPLFCDSGSVCSGVHADEDAGSLLDWSAGRRACPETSHPQLRHAAVHSRQLRVAPPTCATGDEDFSNHHSPRSEDV